jgi:hypothetical protein
LSGASGAVIDHSRVKSSPFWVKSGRMPNLVMLQLPSDHTRGATPDASTAQAMVADNDLALGQIVEGLSRSPFWPTMAILVVEDDAQNGVDHVDGHRTVALAVSPYVRRGAVDSTFYAQQSMVKTIELMLGLPTLSLFDLIATDMRASFTTTPDVRPYTAVRPKQSLFDRNPRLSSMSGPLREAAIETMRMRFDVPDAAPTDRLNRTVWGIVQGWDRPYPAVRAAVFSPFGINLEDDERETGLRRYTEALLRDGFDHPAHRKPQRSPAARGQTSKLTLLRATRFCAYQHARAMSLTDSLALRFV